MTPKDTTTAKQGFQFFPCASFTGGDTHKIKLEIIKLSVAYRLCGEHSSEVKREWEGVHVPTSRAVPSTKRHPPARGSRGGHRSCLAGPGSAPPLSVGARRWWQIQHRLYSWKDLFPLHQAECFPHLTARDKGLGFLHICLFSVFKIKG